jgi:hypothetical protein
MDISIYPIRRSDGARTGNAVKINAKAWEDMKRRWGSRLLWREEIPAERSKKKIRGPEIYPEIPKIDHELTRES